MSRAEDSPKEIVDPGRKVVYLLRFDDGRFLCAETTRVADPAKAKVFNTAEGARVYRDDVLGVRAEAVAAQVVYRVEVVPEPGDE